MLGSKARVWFCNRERLVQKQPKIYVLGGVQACIEDMLCSQTVWVQIQVPAIWMCVLEQVAYPHSASVSSCVEF